MNSFLPPIEFYTSSIWAFILILGSIGMMLLSTSKKGNNSKFLYFLHLLVLFTALGGHLLLSSGPGEFLNGGFTSGGIGFLGVTGILTLGIIMSILMFDTYPRSQFYRGEILAIFLMTITGMCLFVSTQDRVTLFVALELSSLGLYSLVGYINPSRKSIEVAIKYFLLGAFSTAIMIFGLALLYLATGSLHFSAMASLTQADTHPIGVTTGSIFFISGLLFKLAVVPFHSWAPDAYESAPTGLTGFMATAVKMMVLTFFVNYGFYFSRLELWTPMITILATLSIVFGNCLALVQTSIKRTLAYSSIAHSGYLLIALCSTKSHPLLSIESIAYYLLGYILASMALFASLMWLESRTHNDLHLDDVSGLSKQHPYISFAIFVSLISLAGLPPTIGFLGKFFIFYVGIKSQLFPVVIIAAIFSAVSLYYYLRIAVRIYMKDRSEHSAPIAPIKAPLTFAMIGVFVGCIFMGGTLFSNYTFEKMSHSLESSLEKSTERSAEKKISNDKQKV